jgi:hypothetical protein
MKNFKYTLEKYSGIKSRFRCPSCQHDKKFTRYINTLTGEYIAEHVGKCERIDKCGYHCKPKDYFQQTGRNLNNEMNVKKGNYIMPNSLIIPPSYLPYNLMEATMKSYSENNFIQFMVNQFGSTASDELIKKYFIGTSKHWTGATVFWQIDISGNIRTGKIMLYNPKTGKRVKGTPCYISWVHKVMELPEFNLVQCYFGEHLLIDKAKTVALVESEKTAVIASLYFPELIWLAVGSITNLTLGRCKPLTGRKVLLVPDLKKGFELWSEKAKELSTIGSFLVSDALERIATDKQREEGLDIADFLLDGKIISIQQMINQ